MWKTPNGKPEQLKLSLSSTAHRQIKSNQIIKALLANEIAAGLFVRGEHREAFNHRFHAVIRLLRIACRLVLTLPDRLQEQVPCET